MCLNAHVADAADECLDSGTGPINWSLEARAYPNLVKLSSAAPTPGREVFGHGTCLIPSEN